MDWTCPHCKEEWYLDGLKGRAPRCPACGFRGRPPAFIGIEHLAGHRITDLKATGFENRPCVVCGERIAGTVYRASLCKGEGPGFDLYVGEHCYRKIREACEVDSFAKIFGS